MHFIMTDGKTLSISFNSLLATTTLQAADYKVYDSSNALLSGWSTTILDNVDGFGKFDISVGTNGAPNRIPEGTIIITLGSASDAKIVNFVDWSTGGDADRAPALFAAEYAPTTGNTGFVGSYGTEAAPAPPSVLLAASGALFCGLGGLVRRWRRPTVTA